MQWELRRYRIRTGSMAQWISEWASSVVPLRRAHAFVVLGGWVVDGSDDFVWIVGYDGDRAAFNAANDAYYADPARQRVRPDPARHIEVAGHEWLAAIIEPELTVNPRA
jgi:hypothetical protein